jgi:hypothetical protein
MNVILTVGLLEALELDGLRVVDHGGEPGVHVGGGARVRHGRRRVVARARRLRHDLLRLRTRTYYYLPPVAVACRRDVRQAASYVAPLRQVAHQYDTE